MRMMGCDLHAAQQSVAMLDDDTGEVVERTLKHEGDQVREFYAALPAPVVVGLLSVRGALYCGSIIGTRRRLGPGWAEPRLCGCGKSPQSHAILESVVAGSLAVWSD